MMATLEAQDVTVAQVTSAGAFREIDRFRYEIYVREMGRTSLKGIDHAEQRLSDPLDRLSHVFAARAEGRVVGMMRTTWTRDLRRDHELVDLYAIPALGEPYPEQTSITSQLIVTPSLRGSLVPLRLARMSFEKAWRHGIRYDFLDCNRPRLPLFERLGYRPHRGWFDRPGYGRVCGMVLDFSAEELARRRSPLLSSVRRMSRG